MTNNNCRQTIISLEQSFFLVGDIVCSVDDQFQCETGQCITKTWQCDGQEDCADGSDEKDCSAKQCDPTNQYQCPADPSAGYEATCINLTWKCDGEPDCPNGEDEVGCAERTCESGRFLCQESANKTACLPKRWKCDGDVDCLDGVDEQGCDSAPAHEVNRGGCTEGLEFQVSFPERLLSLFSALINLLFVLGSEFCRIRCIHVVSDAEKSSGAVTQKLDDENMPYELPFSFLVSLRRSNLHSRCVALRQRR